MRRWENDHGKTAQLDLSLRANTLVWAVWIALVVGALIVTSCGGETLNHDDDAISTHVARR